MELWRSILYARQFDFNDIPNKYQKNVLIVIYRRNSNVIVGMMSMIMYDNDDDVG